MRRVSWLLGIICLFLGFVQSAQATVRIRVDLASQTMAVTSGGGASYVWAISSGRSGFATPRGTYGVTRMMSVAYSNLYNNAPMPHSIFFTGAYAIHGTYATGALGRPASHGCIRLAPGNAAALFSMVRAEGAVISIGGGGGPQIYTAGRHHKGKTYLAGISKKKKKAVRLAKLQRLKTTGYLAYAPPPRGPSLKAWLKHPTQSF